MTVPPIPLKSDFLQHPQESMAAAKLLTTKIVAEGDQTSMAIALGIAARLVAAAAPKVGAEIGGTTGCLAADATQTVSSQLASQAQKALISLPTATQGLVSLAIDAAANGIVTKISIVTGIA